MMITIIGPITGRESYRFESRNGVVEKTGSQPQTDEEAECGLRVASWLEDGGILVQETYREGITLDRVETKDVSEKSVGFLHDRYEHAMEELHGSVDLTVPRDQPEKTS